MNSLLEQMIAQLSDEDKVIFNNLSERLNEINGDISQLSADELELIKQMEAKYGNKINQVHEQQSAADNPQDLIDTPFGNYVRQVLARDLANEFPQEAAAVAFAFENKWLPVDCQEENLIADIYDRYKDDIHIANQWRDEMLSVDSDRKMAVGLAWFMVIYQLHQRLQ
ncbi:hypothetical protein [Aliikangiella coralliicola]|uniref:Uncharacterized protein n=1 Tax=Aliikangiella coralliicola TaxID=2592383 RepID=A0A545TZX7_9GAMM|nr:hypothetical protein [Aliikangiella coralliicola]TQV82766.1 hypothetical protein FLL46_23615 [Aliikangiella coralliicola]